MRFRIALRKTSRACMLSAPACSIIAATLSTRSAPVSANVPAASENLANFFCNVVPAMIEHVRHVFHEDNERGASFDIGEVFDVKPRARIVSKGFRMFRNLAKLRAPDTCEGLAGRAAHDYVEGQCRMTQIKPFCELRGPCLYDVAGLVMPVVAAMEIETM